MNRKVKLVISDVDGTLLDRKDTITEGLVRLKELIKQQNIPLTLASGRCYANLSKLVEYLDVKLPVVVNNGTGIMTKEKVYWSRSICPGDIKDAVQYADECGMLVSFCDEINETVYRKNAYVQSHIDRFGKTYEFFLSAKEQASDEEWERQNIQKLLIIDVQKPGRIDEVIKRIQCKNQELSIVRYDDRSIDVMPHGCSKDHGVKKLSEILGIDKEEILAVGDNENDIQMLQIAGVGAAVRNATEALKNNADYVSRNDGAAGVVEAIEKFFAVSKGK